MLAALTGEVRCFTILFGYLIILLLRHLHCRRWRRCWVVRTHRAIALSAAETYHLVTTAARGMFSLAALLQVEEVLGGV
jgi:hypothetical protein